MEMVFGGVAPSETVTGIKHGNSHQQRCELGQLGRLRAFISSNATTSVPALLEGF
jgi:hypothetical protein